MAKVRGDIDSPNIWVIEDDPIEVTLIRHVLDRLAISNKTIRVFRRGAEAIRALRSGPGEPDMVFVDLHLPDMTGDRLVQRLRAVERDNYLPLAALSASDDWSSIQRMYTAGVNAYLIKPMDIGTFSSNLGGALAFLWLLSRQKRRTHLPHSASGATT